MQAQLTVAPKARNCTELVDELVRGLVVFVVVSLRFISIKQYP